MDKRIEIASKMSENLTEYIDTCSEEQLLELYILVFNEDELAKKLKQFIEG